VAAVEGEEAVAQQDAVFVALAQDDDPGETALEELARVPLAVVEALLQVV
jgi:hypothetical protein